MIKDDRGREVTQFDEGALARLSGDRARQVTASAAAAGYATYWTKLGKADVQTALAVGIVAVLLLVGNGRLWPMQPLVLTAAAFIVLSIPIRLLMRRAMRAEQAGLLRKAMLRERLCPSCGHDLTDAKAEMGAAPGPVLNESEIVQCAECGAWWKITATT
jgi:uncharacterized protein with PIN domain